MFTSKNVRTGTTNRLLKCGHNRLFVHHGDILFNAKLIKRVSEAYKTLQLQ